MPFSGGEVSEKGFPRGWEAPAEDLSSQRVFRITQLLEAMVFRPFAWDRFNSLNLTYAYHGGLIDAGDKWLLIPDGRVTLVEGSEPNFIERSDAGVVASSQVDLTSATFDRQRSAALSIPASAKEYAARCFTTAAATEVIVASAKIIIL